MYYLIHTEHHPRPYLTTVSFIAHDFSTWGCRVTSHAKTSAYITEIRFQEQRHRPASRREELMEVWAKEVLTRKQLARGEARRRDEAVGLGEAEKRRERAAGVVGDFMAGIAVFESPFKAPRPLQNDPLPLPSYPLALTARYTRLLHRCAYATSAPIPSWADPGVLVVDQVVLEFRADRSIERGQLEGALREAVGKAEGRMGRVERCKQTGLARVLLWVEVGDLVVGKAEGKELGEPVPVYEIGDWVWPPGYEGVEEVRA